MKNQKEQYCKEVAYYIWEFLGKPDNSELDCWLMAESFYNNTYLSLDDIKDNVSDYTEETSDLDKKKILYYILGFYFSVFKSFGWHRLN